MDAGPRSPRTTRSGSRRTMRGNRLINLANDFYENYGRERAREYEERHRIESKLAQFEREVWNEAIENAAMECTAYARLTKGDAYDAAQTLERSIGNLKR